MLRKKKFKVLSIVTLSLIISTVVQASGYKPSNNTYSVNHNFYDSQTNKDYVYNWEVSIIPKGQGNINSQGNKDTNSPNKEDKPVQPSKPVEQKPQDPKPVEPSSPSLPNNVAGLSQMEMEVVRLVNIERQKQGLKAFTASSELSNVARLKSEDMAKNNYFSHTSPKYGSPFDMMKAFGIKYTSAGENIAKGYISAQSVVTGWMNSSGHRANILNPSFNTLGVGAYTDSKGTIYWTQMFTN